MQNEYINPFDNTDHQFFVLINDKQQQSLWPTFTDVPKGWHVLFGPEQREKCMAFLLSASS
ncbi:MbtH family protein [Psychromonas sp. 14N.309.X.WAT.B.A12]|uniref:MbtH family protein n=1 Tax=unclassified Psychromonas TaxID=2614957 RepID=UPI0025AED21E|nr:MbtH family protein [Psychromonas sp. 14N.309.X.WAT.B.A12]MDN2662326.1 MbtH family protein [Psychromonas sp. 14N.309.X.WAT.B.A12]